MELAREREQWQERQHMHDDEAASLRAQLHRLHHLYQQADPAAHSTGPPLAPQQHPAGASNATATSNIFEVEAELEATTREKFALQEQLLSAQAALDAACEETKRLKLELEGAGGDGAMLEQLQRAREAKISAEVGNREALCVYEHVCMCVCVCVYDVYMHIGCASRGTCSAVAGWRSS